MSDQTAGLIIREDTTISTELLQFERSLLLFIGKQGLPIDAVLVPVSERQAVLRNITEVVYKIDGGRRSDSIYLSKFIAAASSGLFDAALNYLWDETIYELRRRVALYDLAYFFDVAVGNNTDKRKKLNTEDDLQKIDDSELIRGANEIGLISDLGYKHLDYIRYMRNWASAAHPNQNEITGLQLVSMLETCIVEVIRLPLSNIVVEIKQLLANIKTSKITQEDANRIAVFFAGLTQERANTLASGLFGIYTQLETTPQTRQNVQLLIPLLWDLVDEDTRQQFGIRYARFIASNDQDKVRLARQFLDTVSGISYLPEDIRVAEIETAIDNLLTAHRGLNNFYNEPAFARQLQRLVGETGNIPSQVGRKYVYSLVEVFLSNGNGIAWNAEPVYIEMLSQLSATHASRVVVSFVNQTINSRLQFKLCQLQYRRLLVMMKEKVTMPIVKELINEIESFNGPLDKMRDVSKIKVKIDAVRRIVGG